jgi:hypothetical protein
MGAYDHRRVGELDDLLGKRGLSADGSKADKIAALEAADTEESGGRIVKRPVYVPNPDGYSDAVFYDVGAVMPEEHAARVGAHVFTEDPDAPTKD